MFYILILHNLHMCQSWKFADFRDISFKNKQIFEKLFIVAY